MTVFRIFLIALLAGTLVPPVMREARAQALPAERTVPTKNDMPGSPGKVLSGKTAAKTSLSLDRKLVMDPSVIRGTLPNGLQYFIRSNPHPAQRAELRLVVNAGSVLEDEGQRGVAHFIEHMAFRRTKSFASHELITYLQSVGMKFGADLNAATSYDETIYKLTVPTDSAGEVLRKGVQILQEWASAATFDSAEVVAERGVILEERRVRGGVGMRMLIGRDSLLFAGTRYATRLPIGNEESIQNITPALLQRFYGDWYRPELMSVVMVGDFNARQMEALIRRQFGDIPKSRYSRVRPAINFDIDNARVALLHDSQQSAWIAQMYFPKAADAPTTVGQYRGHLADRLLSMVLSQRLAQVVRTENTPVLNAQFGLTSLRRAMPVYALMVQTKEEGYFEGVTLALAELERIAQHGVTATELVRAQKQMIATSEAGNLGQDSRTSEEFAEEYVQVALQPALVSLSGKAAVGLVREVVPTITSTDLQTLAQSLRRSRTSMFVGMTPVTGQPITDSMVVSSLRHVDTMTLAPYEDKLGTAPLLGIKPVPGPIVEEHRIESLGVTEWTFSNGVRVLLKPTTLNPGRIELQGFKLGGLALATESDYINAGLAPTVIGMSGAGAYTNTEIASKLAGTVVSVVTSIDQTATTVKGQAASHDLATFFELIYLKFTAPRIDTVAVRNWRNSSRSRGIDPVQEQMHKLLTNGDPRARPILGWMLDSLDTDKALAFYRELFGDASGFTFALVGDFDIQTIRPLVEQFVGGLPSRRQSPLAMIDHKIRPQQGPVRQTITTSTTDPVSRSQMVYAGPFDFNRRSQREIDALASVLRMRLTEKLREELGGTYTVQAEGRTGHEPYSHYHIMVAYTSAPERTTELQREVLAVVDSLRRYGPTRNELHAVKEEQRRTIELGLQQNAFWAGMLTGYLRNGWDLEGLNRELAISQEFTIQDLQQAAREYLPDDRSIFVSSIPAGYIEPANIPVNSPFNSAGTMSPVVGPRPGVSPVP